MDLIMLARSGKRLLLLAALLCCVCLAVVLYKAGGGEPYETWYDVGPVQVLGGPDDVWVFAERSTIVRIPGALVSAPVRTVNRHQEVVVFDATGEKQRVIIPGPGPSFHPNISRVFRQADGIYLIRGESMNDQRAMFRWSENRFQLLPLEESERWLREVGLGAVPLPFDPAIDRMTVSNGWEHLYESRRGVDGRTFEWRELPLHFELDQGARTSLRIVAASERPLQVDVLEFASARRNITRQEAEALGIDEESGHRRP